MRDFLKRRDFLRGAGLVLGSAATSAMLPSHAFAATGSSIARQDQRCCNCCYVRDPEQ